MNLDVQQNKKDFFNYVVLAPSLNFQSSNTSEVVEREAPGFPEIFRLPFPYTRGEQTWFGVPLSHCKYCLKACLFLMFILL